MEMTRHDKILMAAFLRFEERGLSVLSVAHLALGLPFPVSINGHVPDMLVRDRGGQEIIIEAEDEASLWTRSTADQLRAFAWDRSRRLIVATSEPIRIATRGQMMRIDERELVHAQIAYQRYLPGTRHSGLVAAWPGFLTR